MYRVILLFTVLCMSTSTSNSQTKPSGPMTNDTMPMYGTEDLLSETFDSIRNFDHLVVGHVKEKDMPAILARLQQMPKLTTLEFLHCDLSKMDENSPVPANVKELGIAQEGGISQSTLRWLAKFPKGKKLLFGCDVRKLSFDDLGKFTWITFDNCEISRSALKLVGDTKIFQVTFKEVTFVDDK